MYMDAQSKSGPACRAWNTQGQCDWVGTGILGKVVTGLGLGQWSHCAHWIRGWTEHHHPISPHTHTTDSLQLKPKRAGNPKPSNPNQEEKLQPSATWLQCPLLTKIGSRLCWKRKAQRNPVYHEKPGKQGWIWNEEVINWNRHSVYFILLTRVWVTPISKLVPLFCNVIYS